MTAERRTALAEVEDRLAEMARWNKLIQAERERLLAARRVLAAGADQREERG